MSLIHWWPLNGDTQDKIGGKNGTIVGTATLTETGKIGKCLSAGDGTQITAGVSVANCNLLDELTEEYSASMWIKVHGTHVHYEGAFISSGDWNNKRWTFGINQANNRIQPLTNASNQNYISLGKTLTNDQWYHVTTVYKGGKAYLYLDGVLINSITATAPYQSSATNLCIGRETYASGYFSFNGDICDVRIYDHALSQAEVKELSRALVVHYTFDDVLAEPTTNLVTQGALSWSKLTVNISSSHSKGVYTITTTTANNDASSGQIRANFPLAILTTGETYYFSCKYRVISGTGTFTLSDWCDSSLSDKKTKDCGDFYELSAKCYTTRTYNSTYRFLDCNLSANSVIEIWDVQLQTNDKVTPYVNGTRESMLYNESGLTQPNKSTNIKIINDSASGLYSLSCGGSTVINTPILGDISSGATISCWIKTPTYPSTNAIVFADYNSKLAFGFYGTQAAIISCGGQSAPYISNIKSSWIDGWNHVVVIRDSSGTISCYLNGIKMSTTGSNNWSSTAGYSTIGCRYNGSYTTYCNCYVDDYRIYHTVLSEEEIQDLYKVKGYISNYGDILTHTFVENKDETQVTSKYIFESKEFFEEIDAEYDVVEYLESTGTQYIDTGYITISSDYTYELDMTWTGTNVSGFYSFMGFMASGTVPRAGLHNYSSTLMFGANATTNSSVSPISGERYVYKGRFKSGTQKLYKNDSEIASNTTTFDHSTNTLSTYIFGRNYASGKNLASMKLYEAKIYEGITPVCHYIPMRRKSDNVLGLYEINTKTFLVNSGTGTFVAGPTLTNNSASIYENKNVSGRNLIEI